MGLCDTFGLEFGLFVIARFRKLRATNDNYVRRMQPFKREFLGNINEQKNANLESTGRARLDVIKQS